MDINSYLNNLKDQLFRKNNLQSVVISREWASQIPAEAGVYILMQNGIIVYVGETGNLRERMNDLLDSRHHTVRRTIGERYFSTEEGFIQATTKIKFPDHIEVMVNNHICTNLLLGYLVVPLGRKELEELVESEMILDTRLNKRGKRKAK